MNIHTIARLCALLVGVSANLVSTAPPASALGAGAVIFHGVATVTTGLGVPVITGGTLTVTPGGLGKKTPLFTVGGGNVRTGAFASTTCLGVKLMILKNKVPVVPGAPVAFNGLGCAVVGTFLISGYCGLSSGSGTGTASFAPSIPTLPLPPFNRVSFNYTWTDPGGGNLVVLGNWWFGTGPKPATPDGDMEGYARIMPVSVPLGTSCLNKTQQSFLISAEVGFLHPKVMFS